ncbi:hypothetical protein AMATHDRAFT_194465 [Amanita thiersii Skay4041]|uniref:Uncharacterized protein n=1 Tax=Amanita thiersii Skay4041 TaxID=703135 RepID=A0A2A9NPT2_9AGAR|nr:hypothetical protein AMATHDRAFT_194465 [Amanita thiersii Skay4041]
MVSNEEYASQLDGTLQGGLYIKKVPSSYSPAQITQYLSRIGFSPTEYVQESLIANNMFPSTLENLERIVRLHLCSFAFENTAMHYTPEHVASVDSQALFNRFISEGKGFYCLGHNSFLLEILRGLGYRAYNAAARVNAAKAVDPTEYATLTHLVILVQPFWGCNRTYLADVGFGAGLSRPILLSEAEENIVTGITPSERFRLRWRADPRSSLESCSGAPPKEWVLEVQHLKSNTPDADSSPWTPQFMFFEKEFFSPDIADASLVIATRPFGIFWNNVFVVKHYLLDDEGKIIYEPSQEERAKGDITKRDLGRIVLLGAHLTFIIGPQSEVKILKNEMERVSVLRELFGIQISNEAVRFMQGRVAALETPYPN